jgi:hypothetical protein
MRDPVGETPRPDLLEDSNYQQDDDDNNDHFEDSHCAFPSEAVAGNFANLTVMPARQSIAYGLAWIMSIEVRLQQRVCRACG